MVPSPRDLAATRREIETALRDALGGFGVAAGVNVVGNEVQLVTGSGAPVAIELGPLVEQWPLLPPDMRQRRIGEVARRLVSAQRSVSRAPDAREGDGFSSRVLIALGAAAVLVLSTGGVWLFRRSTGAEADRATAASAAPTETEAEAKARRARVCEATRKRVYSGASIGPFDVEGWYVELLLVGSGRDDPGKSPKLGPLFDDGRLTAAADAELSAVPNGTVEIAPPPERFTKSPGAVASIVRFSGGYVGAYLDPRLRARFLALADRIADESGASLGALYGRCAHLAYHDLGAWFRGPDAAGAATALVYAMGVYAEAPAVDPSLLALQGTTSELEAVARATAKIDERSLAAVVGESGGSVTRPGAAALTISFPLGGGTRATSASRAVAERAGIGAP